MRRALARAGRAPNAAVQSWRAFRWAKDELARVKYHLDIDGSGVRASRPPSGVAPYGHRGLAIALRRISPTCLERALVLQSWAASFDDPPEVVIGVRRGDRAVEAHAWVEGADPDPWFDASYEEITRLSW